MEEIIKKIANTLKEKRIKPNEIYSDKTVSSHLEYKTNKPYTYIDGHYIFIKNEYILRHNGGFGGGWVDKCTTAIICDITTEELQKIKEYIRQSMYHA